MFFHRSKNHFEFQLHYTALTTLVFSVVEHRHIDISSQVNTRHMMWNHGVVLLCGTQSSFVCSSRKRV